MVIYEEFFEELNRLCEDLDWNLSINRGGCCYVAYVIAKNLEKRKIPFKLVMFEHKMFGGFKNTNKLNLRNNIKQHNVWFAKETYAHYCICVNDNMFLNAGSFGEDKRYENTKVCYIKAKDISFLYRHGSWNDWYDKLDNNEVKKEINDLFNEYFK